MSPDDSELRDKNEFFDSRADTLARIKAIEDAEKTKPQQENAMKKIEVYVDNNGQPQHLAVRTEVPVAPPGGRTCGSIPLHRAVCGQDTGVLKVVEIDAREVKFECANCENQLKIWKEVHA